MAPELIFMDSKFYNAAVEGKINAFKQGVEHIEQLLTPNKNTVLHIHFTAETGKVSKDFVEDIINLCPSIVLQVNAKEETPLHIAARYGHFEAVETLIRHSRTLPEGLESGIGANQKLVRATNKVGDSAVHEAVRYEHIKVVELLLKEDSDHSCLANDDDETPLYLAVERDYKDIVFEILQNCNSPAYGGPAKSTALHAAVIRNDKEMVKRLLEKEYLKPSINEADELGWLPLHLAAALGYHDLTLLLLKNDKSTAYIKDNNGRTALQLAARQNKRHTMAAILSYCPDCAEIVDNNRQNALHHALHHALIDSDNYTVAKLILENPSLSNLYNEKDADGNTPLHLFSSLERLPIKTPNLIQNPRVDKLAFNKENRTAYHITRDQLINIDCRNPPVLQKVTKRGIIMYGLHKYGARKIGYLRRQKPQAIKKKDDHNCNRGRGNINKKDKDDESSFVKRAKDSHLVVATLIATVAFAAGISLPGGTIQEGEYKGTPVLKDNAAFKAFVVTDTIAMVLSAIAVYIHFFLIVYRGETRIEFLGAFVMTMAALGALLVAFVTGTMATLGVSSGLGIFVLLIVSVFFFFVLVSLFFSYFLSPRGYNMEGIIAKFTA